ncbi:hypothetical protein ABPG73_022666 [Tetrahymena malaccensis]
MINKIFEVFDSKINFLSQDTKKLFEDIFVKIWPLLKGCCVQDIFNRQEDFELVKNITDEMLQDFIILLKKKQQIENQDNQYQSFTKIFKEQQENIFSLFEKSELDRVLQNFPQDMQPIRFEDISQEKLQEINEYTEHLIKLQDDTFSQQIQSSQRMKKIQQIFENKANFITSEMKTCMNEALLKIYPFLKPIDSIELFSQEDSFNTLQNQSDEYDSENNQVG